MNEQNQNKAWYQMKRVWAALFLTLVIGYALGAASNNTNQSNNSQAQESSKQETAKSTPEVPKTWQQVATLSGSTSKRSDVFELKGGETKLKYTTTGGDSSALNIYVMKEGTSLEESGGFAEVTGATKSDETKLVKPAGRYYLDVTAANTEWSVVIEELK